MLIIICDAGTRSSEIQVFLDSVGLSNNLVLGGELITLIIGTRFLTDHLDGDNYYKIHREWHNLDRCRTQLKLVQSILEQEEQIKSIVEEL